MGGVCAFHISVPVLLPQDTAPLKIIKSLPRLINERSWFILWLEPQAQGFPNKCPIFIVWTEWGDMEVGRGRQELGEVLSACCTLKTRVGCNATNLSGIVHWKGYCEVRKITLGEGGGWSTSKRKATVPHNSCSHWQWNCLAPVQLHAARGIYLFSSS